MEYLATFYTHFAAQSFVRRLKGMGVKTRLMPTPRAVSASCGSCASFATDADFIPLLVEDTEAVYRYADGRYLKLWQNES